MSPRFSVSILSPPSRAREFGLSGKWFWFGRGKTEVLGRCHQCCETRCWYMFQFHRILQYAQPPSGSQQPFFWLFVDNLLLTEDDQVTAARFFQLEAVTLQDVRGRVLQNAVRVWSNIPGLKSKHSALTPKEEQSLETQTRTRGKMAAQKVDRLVKTCLLPLREYFKYFSQNPLPLYK
uniref:DNA (cytosine-5)-methyltransferase 3-like isoform X2 n=1 Tax=Myodes glareolus TaxID=447135 RepID=UPI00201FC395|nr:DNA (cytosine-5)-methyltransferase 3-like isoform X2 [Myodes glareolus]